MHFSPSMIPLSYQFYASLVLVSVFGGVGAFCLTLVAMYGLGGVELVLAMLFVSFFGLLRIVIPSLSQSASDRYAFWEEKKIEDLAIDTFVLKEEHEMIASGSCCPICLSEFQVGHDVAVVSRCQHVYHTECLKLWLPRSTTCPYCRSDLELRCPETRGSANVQKTGAFGIFEGIFDSICL